MDDFRSRNITGGSTPQIPYCQRYTYDKIHNRLTRKAFAEIVDDVCSVVDSRMSFEEKIRGCARAAVKAKLFGSNDCVDLTTAPRFRAAKVTYPIVQVNIVDMSCAPPRPDLKVVPVTVENYSVFEIKMYYDQRQAYIYIPGVSVQALSYYIGTRMAGPEFFKMFLSGNYASVSNLGILISGEELSITQKVAHSIQGYKIVVRMDLDPTIPEQLSNTVNRLLFKQICMEDTHTCGDLLRYAKLIHTISMLCTKSDKLTELRQFAASIKEEDESDQSVCMTIHTLIPFMCKPILKRIVNVYQTEVAKGDLECVTNRKKGFAILMTKFYRKDKVKLNVYRETSFNFSTQFLTIKNGQVVERSDSPCALRPTGSDDDSEFSPGDSGTDDDENCTTEEETQEEKEGEHIPLMSSVPIRKRRRNLRSSDEIECTPEEGGEYITYVVLNTKLVFTVNLRFE